ncbi:MAG: hypothetical protein U1D55_00455 [Phycisphaerae bacterium]
MSRGLHSPTSKAARGNLTGDGLHLYRYDAWNRLVGVWYADAGGTGDAGQRVAAYAYDALFRRVSKTVSNQGLGCVHGWVGRASCPPIEFAASRAPTVREGSSADLGEPLPYGRASDGSVSRRSFPARPQTLFGTQYIDEPVCRDRNTDPVAGASPDSDCLDAGGSQRYFYHQDANYRVTLLTAESGGVVERYDYSAYGEPAVFGGAISGGLGESGGR